MCGENANERASEQVFDGGLEVGVAGRGPDHHHEPDVSWEEEEEEKEIYSLHNDPKVLHAMQLGKPHSKHESQKLGKRMIPLLRSHNAQELNRKGRAFE